MVFIGQTKQTGTGKKKGRRSTYEEKIQPYLPQIYQWAQEKTEAQIYAILGVGKDAWIRAKDSHQELREALKKGRTELVKELYSTLIRKSQGFQYTEKKTVKELDANGNLIIVREEEYTRTALPDVAALHLLLKNYDKEHWAENPQLLELKRQELEIQKQKADATAW